MDFRRAPVFSSATVSALLHGTLPRLGLTAVLGSGKTFSSQSLVFLDLFLHDGMAACFSILLVALPAPLRQRAERVAGLPPSAPPKNSRRTLTSDGTLIMFNEMHGNGASLATRQAMALGWHDQKIHFPFPVNCATSGYQKGLAECWCRDHQRLSILETGAQSTPLVRVRLL
jgi:hypothetical protein